MHVHVNLLGVLLAAVSSMIIGTIYYADTLFGKNWKKLSKINEAKFKEQMPKIMPLVFIGALVTSYVVAYITYLFQYFFQTSWVAAGFETSILLWLGLSATTLFIHDSMDQKPFQLTIVSMGNRLLSILAMGLIVGWIHP